MTKANENLTWRFFSMAAFWAAIDLCELSMSCTFDIAWCQWISIETKAQVSLITGCAFQCKIFCDEKKNKIREAINNITSAIVTRDLIWNASVSSQIVFNFFDERKLVQKWIHEFKAKVTQAKRYFIRIEHFFQHFVVCSLNSMRFIGWMLFLRKKFFRFRK